MLQRYSTYIDSKLEFFYLEKNLNKVVFKQGLSHVAEKKLKEILSRIEPQKDGTKLFEHVLVRDKSGWPSYNHFQEEGYLKIAPQSFLVKLGPHHKYYFVSKGCSGHTSASGPRQTIHFVLEEMFAIDPNIIAAYSFLDINGDWPDTFFDDFMVTDSEKEKLIHGVRGIPNFHGVEVITCKTLRNNKEASWKCFDWLQTIEDSALLEAQVLGSSSLEDVRPSLEWLHQKNIESEIKNIVQQLEKLM